MKPRFVVGAILVLFITVIAMPAHAVWRVGITYENLRLTSIGGNTVDDVFNGVGLNFTNVTSLSKSNGLGLEYGGKIALVKGSSYHRSGAYYGEDRKYLVVSVIAPVNLVYNFQLNNTFSVVPFAGLNLKVHAHGEEKGDMSTSELFGGDNGWNRFQAGWQAGVGFYIKNFHIVAGYGTDFIPIYKKDGRKVNTSSLSAGIGLIF